MGATIYLIRHVQAAGNLMKTFQGSSNCDVTPKGERQMERLSERFRTISLDAVYASPLLRACKTAEAVGKYHGLPVRVREGLREIDCGDWEGRGFNEIKDHAAYRDWCYQPHRFVAPNGESMQQVYDRMVEGMDTIVRENLGGTAAVVSHGCALKAYLCKVTGIPLERMAELKWLDNASVTQVEYDDYNTPRLILFNDVSHLSPEDQSGLLN